MVDEYGFRVDKQQEHFMLYRDNEFKCSCDNDRELEEAKREILGY